MKINRLAVKVTRKSIKSKAGYIAAVVAFAVGSIVAISNCSNSKQDDRIAIERAADEATAAANKVAELRSKGIVITPDELSRIAAPVDRATAAVAEETKKWAESPPDDAYRARFESAEKIAKEELDRFMDLSNQPPTSTDQQEQWRGVCKTGCDALYFGCLVPCDVGLCEVCTLACPICIGICVVACSAAFEFCSSECDTIESPF